MRYCTAQSVIINSANADGMTECSAVNMDINGYGSWVVYYPSVFWGGVLNFTDWGIEIVFFVSVSCSSDESVSPSREQEGEQVTSRVGGGPL